MDLTTILAFFQDVTGHKWLPLAILVVAWLVAACSDTSKLPISIPDRYKPVAVIVLGQVYAVLQAITGGVPWKRAVWNGLVTAFGAMALFDVIVKTIWQGHPPAWLAKFTFIDPKLVEAKKSVGLTTKFFGGSKPSMRPPPPPVIDD